RVGPLEVVEEEEERSASTGEGAEELSEHHGEAVLLLRERQRRDGGLLADDERDLGDEVDDELRVRPEGAEQPVAPRGDALLGLGEDLTDDVREGLSDRGVGNVALVLIELPGEEEATRRRDDPVELLDERGLPDAGVPRDEDELRLPGRDDP